MSKAKIRPFGLDSKGHFLMEVTDGDIPGQVAKGDIIACRPTIPGKPLAAGYKLGTAQVQEDGSLDFEVVDGSGSVYEDRSAEKSSSGPAKVNSNAFRSGWERTFAN